MLAHAIAEIRVWEFFLDPDLIAANDRPQTAANDGFYGHPATFVYENTVGKLFWTRYYEYAENGNRLLANSTTGDDPEGPYSHEYDHDAHGNMISMPHLSSMIWNHDDEMQEVAVGSETVYFQYAGGNRTRKFVEKSGTITEERIYLGAFEIFRKRISGDIDVERESLHISDGTGRILLIETLTIDEGDAVGSPVGMWRYQLSNHIGSASTEINEDGDIISHEEYHPYGTSAYRAVDSSIDVSARRYRYSGMERDDETGLGHHTARYYASWLGRWTASDPIGLAGGGNRFEYCGGNPVGRVDPNGQAPPEWSNVGAGFDDQGPAPTPEPAAGPFSPDPNFEADPMPASEAASETGTRVAVHPDPALVADRTASGLQFRTMSLGEVASSRAAYDQAWQRHATETVESYLTDMAIGRGRVERSRASLSRAAVAEGRMHTAGAVGKIVGGAVLAVGSFVAKPLTAGATFTGVVVGGSMAIEGTAELATGRDVRNGTQILAHAALDESLLELRMDPDEAVPALTLGLGAVSLGIGAGRKLVAKAPDLTQIQVSRLKDQLFLKGTEVGRTGQQAAVERANLALQRWRAGELEVPPGLTRAHLENYREQAWDGVHRTAIHSTKPTGAANAAELQGIRVELIDEILASSWGH